MALVPCNVCGTLNSEDTEICLSCEYPIRGRRRPAVFQWAALLLLIPFAITGLSFAFSWLRPKQPHQSPAERTALRERSRLEQTIFSAKNPGLRI